MQSIAHGFCYVNHLFCCLFDPFRQRIHEQFSDQFLGNLPFPGQMEAAFGVRKAALYILPDKDQCIRAGVEAQVMLCLLYTSPSPRDRTRSRMPSSA